MAYPWPPSPPVGGQGICAMRALTEHSVIAQSLEQAAQRERSRTAAGCIAAVSTVNHRPRKSPQQRFALGGECRLLLVLEVQQGCWMDAGSN